MDSIKLIVCDLDGTLLNSKKQISSYTREILMKTKELGIHICFASGRDDQMMEVYSRCIGGCSYMLSNNGALVRSNNGTILYEAALEKPDIQKILAFLTQQQLVFMMYTAQTMYFSNNSEMLKKRITSYEKLSEEMGYPMKLSAESVTADDIYRDFKDVAKIVVYEDSEIRMNEFLDFAGNLANVHCESTGYGLQGAFHKSVSKKTALLKIMDDLGIKESQVCVFGDYDNDLSMFECAGRRIAMGNSIQCLKDTASEITLSNDEDGVAVYLKKELDL